MRRLPLPYNLQAAGVLDGVEGVEEQTRRLSYE